MEGLRFRILGCGSSGGVPRLGGHWGECDPNNLKNQRRRCSLLVEQETKVGCTRVLIDTTPDLRMQLLDAAVGELDGVVYTHAHADHVHGLDDLRMIVFNMRKRLKVWADEPTSQSLLERFAYAFVQPEGSPYPPILELKRLTEVTEITGGGGTIQFHPFVVRHGSMDALGFRIGPLVYLPDVSDMTEEAWTALKGAELWVLDALRRDPHPTHTHLEQSLRWIKASGVGSAIITNMHVDLDYDTLRDELPDGVVPAYDGLTLHFDVP